MLTYVSIVVIELWHSLMDYLEALEVPVAEVTLAGKVVICKKGSLQLHYRLRTIAVKLLDENSSVVLSACFEYITTATGIEDLSGVGVLEIAPALDALLDLNEGIDELPWQTTKKVKVNGKEEPKKPESIDYANRSLAMIVHVIARTYGWSDEYIFDLQPEVAFAYVQEILIWDHERNEFIYSMTPDLAYNYKTGKYKPYQTLPWRDISFEDPKELKKILIPRQFVPGGVVVDLIKEENGDSSLIPKEK